MQKQLSQFFMQNWLLITLFFVIIYYIIKLEAENSELALTPQQMTLWMNRENNVIVLDIRDQDKFSAAHISGAKHMKLDFPEKNSPWDKFKKKKIILVCDDGRVSRRIRDMVVKAVGHNDVKYLRGGMSCWDDENLPVTV